MKTVSAKPFRIGRRSLLRGLGSIAVALPLLEVMEPLKLARGQAAPPKRFIVMYSQSGTIYERWLPTGTGRNFELSPILAPLEPFKSDIVVVGGLRNSAAQKGPGDDHSKGMGSILTGMSLVGTGKLGAGGISLDQQLANELGTATKFKSLETGVQSGSGNITNYMSHAGVNQPIPADSVPTSVYDRIFGDVVAPSSDPAAPRPLNLLEQRKSVLDVVREGYSSLVTRVSSVDRIKLEAHLDNIRGIEQRLSAATVTVEGAACAAPVKGMLDANNAKLNDNFPAVGKAQLDLIQLAQACDLTRVSTIQFSRESSDPRFTWLGITRGHHSISHDNDSNAQSMDQLTAINRWHAEQYAYLLGKLAANQEGESRQLDNTLVLWVNGLAKGNNHSHAPQTNVLAGSLGGTIETGRVLAFPNTTTTNDLYVSVLNAFGNPTTTFGSFSTGPLPGLLA